MQTKSDALMISLLCVGVPVLLTAGFFLSHSSRYYLTSALILLISMLPVFRLFEKKKSPTREIVALAALTAIAVASRAAFYMLPQVKPIAAVVITAAVSFGYEVGFLVGALSMFLSNMIFGQGSWTPFQMFALGMVGLICGLLFHTSKYRKNRWILGLSGGLLTTVVYGVIVDTHSALMLSADASLQSILAVYAAGIPMNLIFGGITAVLLVLFGEMFTLKLERLTIKYGLFGKAESS